MCLSKSFPLARSQSVAILVINSTGSKQLSLYNEVQTVSWFCRAFWGKSMAAREGGRYTMKSLRTDEGCFPPVSPRRTHQCPLKGSPGCAF